jgi:hypothetical protein
MLFELRYDEPLLNFAFNFKLRRYDAVGQGSDGQSRLIGWTPATEEEEAEAGEKQQPGPRMCRADGDPVASFDPRFRLMRAAGLRALASPGETTVGGGPEDEVWLALIACHVIDDRYAF